MVLRDRPNHILWLSLHVSSQALLSTGRMGGGGESLSFRALPPGEAPSPPTPGSRTPLGAALHFSGCQSGNLLPLAGPLTFLPGPQGTKVRGQPGSREAAPARTPVLRPCPSSAAGRPWSFRQTPLTVLGPRWKLSASPAPRMRSTLLCNLRPLLPLLPLPGSRAPGGAIPHGAALEFRVGQEEGVQSSVIERTQGGGGGRASSRARSVPMQGAMRSKARSLLRAACGHGQESTQEAPPPPPGPLSHTE